MKTDKSFLPKLTCEITENPDGTSAVGITCSDEDYNFLRGVAYATGEESVESLIASAIEETLSNAENSKREKESS